MNVYNLHNGNMAQGNNLKKIIKVRGSSSRELAEALNLRPETISRHITGAVRMTIDDATKYAKELNVSPEAIYVEQTPLESIGSLGKDNRINLFEKGETMEFGGPINYPSNYKAIQLPEYYIPKVESMGVFDGTYMKSKSVSSEAKGSVSICEIVTKKGKREIVLGIPFEVEHFTHNIKLVDSFLERTRKEKSGAPTLISQSVELLSDIELLWAAPILLMIHHPVLMGFIREP